MIVVLTFGEFACINLMILAKRLAIGIIGESLKTDTDLSVVSAYIDSFVNYCCSFPVVEVMGPRIIRYLRLYRTIVATTIITMRIVMHPHHTKR